MTSQRMPSPRRVSHSTGAPSEDSEESLTELVERARAGDRRAWGNLVDRLELVVWKTTYQVDMSQEDREEASQNTWLRLFESLHQLRDPERLPGWLVTTTRHEALAIVRRRKRVTLSRSDTELDVPPHQVDNDQPMIDAELRAALQHAFEHLTPVCQRLLRLLIADPPMRYEEIASQLSTTVGYIGPTRGRCLDHLRATAEMRPFLTGSD